MNAGSIARLALFSMRRHARRSIASTAVLFTFVLTFASVLLFQSALEAHTQRVLQSAPELTVQRIVAGRPALIPKNVADAIAQLPGVRNATARVWGYLYVPPLNANATVVGVANPSMLSNALQHGRTLQANSENEVVLGHAIAQAFAVRDGESVALLAHGTTRVMRVVGVLRRDADVVGADALLLSERAARSLLGVDEQDASDIGIALSTPDESGVVAEKIAAISAEYRVVARPELTRATLLTSTARASFLTLCLLPALAALLLLVAERLSSFDAAARRESALFKTLGFSTRDLLWAKLTESTLVSVTATVLGVLAAYVHVHVLGAPWIRATLLGWSRVLTPPTLPSALTLSDLLGVLLAVVVPYVSVSLLSAWRLAFVDPAETLRGAQ